MSNRTESPGCLVEQAVNAALDQAFRDAETLLLTRLGEVTLGTLSRELRGRLPRGAKVRELEAAHAS
jgi:hypothetical protein